MVENLLADFLTLRLNEEVYVNSLPLGKDYGVYVRVLDEEYEEGRLVETIIGCFVTEANYATCRDKANKVKDSIFSMKGLESWTSGGRVRVSNMGTNKAGDEMIVVTATIYNEGD